MLFPRGQDLPLHGIRLTCSICTLLSKLASSCSKNSLVPDGVLGAMLAALSGSLLLLDRMKS